MLTGMVILLFGLILAIEARKVLKDTGGKEKFVYFALLGVSFCVLMLYSLDIPVPSPTVPIRALLDALL